MLEAVIGAIIMVAAQICKKWITPKYGSSGVHVFIFILAAIATILQLWASQNANVMNILVQAGTLLVGTVGTYHVFFEKLGNAMSDTNML